MIIRNLKYTLRNFRRFLTSTLINILGLAISIAAVLIIWAYIINENKFDQGIPNSKRIFRLESNWASMPSFIGHAINQNLNNQVLATRLAFWGDVGIQINNNPFNLKDLAFADSTFFKIFHLEIINGNAQEALIKPFSLVLTESQAKRLFGSIDAIGKIVRFEDQFDFTVTAIIRDQPFLHFKIDVLASIVSLEKMRHKGILQEYDGWSYPTYLLLPDVTHSTDYETKIIELLKKFGYEQQFRLHSFNEIYYSPEIENESNTKHGNILYNKILIAVSIFILLLAAVNFINLTIANAVARSKEVSIKKLQGASQIQLITQFIFETVITIYIACGLSVIFLWLINPVLTSLTGFPVYTVSLFSHNNLLIFVTGFISLVLIAGIYPSIYISSYTINTNKERLSGYSYNHSIRNGLIIFQNVVSITLICCTLIANQQFRYINKKDLGFNINDIVILKSNSQLNGHLELFKEKLSNYSEIVSVSYSNRIPGDYWGSWCCVNIEGKENKFFNNYVDPDYLKTLGIKIKEGRSFSANNPGDKKATYLINETAIKQYDIKNPIGQFIVPGNGIKGQIIGIIQDFHYRGLKYEQTPLLLFYTTDRVNYINIKVNKNNIQGALLRIKETWSEICPSFAFEYNFLNETYDLQYKSDRRFESMLFIFALLALLIAGIGLFGLSIYSTERRTKEIGIRKISGAKVSEILVILNKDFLKWVAIALILACPIAWYTMDKWLQKFAYKTELSWLIFALAGIIALGTALLTVSWKSWHAATRNPVDALRYE